MTYRELVAFCQETYNNIQEKFETHEIEDWEQVYFDTLEDKLNNDKEKVLVHLFYAYDDSITDVADGITNDLLGEKLIQAVVFEPHDELTISVMVVAKGE